MTKTNSDSETNQIILKEKNGLINDSSTLANLFNSYFNIIKSTFKLKQSPKFSLTPKFSSSTIKIKNKSQWKKTNWSNCRDELSKK